jgi:dTMP kinase
LGFNVKKYHFPNYESPSSSLVKMYLNGEICQNPTDINPYVASQFYAVDRVVSYMKEWRDFYLGGGIVILDRYVESNSIHQGAKFEDNAEKDAFLEWLHHLEYDINRLPKPDIVFFMDMPPEVSQAIMEIRGNKITNGKLDIHEKNSEFMRKSYENAKYVAHKFNWEIIKCTSTFYDWYADPISVVRTREEIANEILKKTLTVI